jgi:D-alanyl-D-alanine carboxypeptidase/D-alanyl-D-alanine-endopeptidase (penicillin-binding protein 4)
LNFNDNCLDSRVRVRDGRVELLLQPHLSPEFLRNALRIGPKHAPRVTRRVDSDIFEFHGPVGRDDELGPTSVRRPALFFGHALRVALEARGIAVRGEIVRRRITASAAARATLLATHSTSLEDVLWRCNTFSQNFFAECLLKSLAAYGPNGQRTGEPGSWERGEDVLQATLKKLGVALDGAVLRDGSGLSHQNRVTAQQVVKLLTTMRRHRAAEVFVGSLAAPGEPGTMQRRYALPELRGRLRGKTGTIQGVQALAGYVSRADGTTLAFALLINGNDAATLPIRVCRALVE